MKTKILALALVLFVLAAPVRAHAAISAGSVSATALVRGFYDRLVETMKQGDKLGFKGRYQKLEPVIAGAFNLPLMTRFAVGPSWAKASATDQQKLIVAFSAFSTATYASRFTRYDGERFEVLGEKPSGDGGAIVETRLTPKDGDPVTLDYRVRPDEKGALRIVDVFLDATISELATRRAEFTTIVNRDGLDGLVAALNEKVKKMEAF